MFFLCSVADCEDSEKQWVTVAMFASLTQQTLYPTLTVRWA